MRFILLLLFTVMSWGFSCSDEDENSANGDGPSGDDDSDTDTDLTTDSSTGSDPGDTEHCPLAGDLGPGEHAIQLSFDGLARDYIVYVPSGYLSSERTPLVFALHGWTSWAAKFAEETQLSATAETNGFIALYPNGYKNSWNAGDCCADATGENIDDVGFLTAVRSDVATRLCVDTSRVYATGMSNGGMMVYRLAAEAAQLFAAVAPVAGRIATPEVAPARPVPILAFHGDADPLVKYAEGKSSFDDWSVIDECTGEPTRTMYEPSYCDLYESCASGVSVGLCTLVGMGHCWPNVDNCPLGEENYDIDANALIWDFFKDVTLD